MNFLLDPYIVAAPKSITTSEQLSDYIETLKGWTDLQKLRKHDFWFTSHLACALSDAKRYPYPTTIKNICKGVKMGEDDAVNLETAIAVIQKDLMEPPYLDDRFIDLQIEHELIESIVLPEEVSNRLQSKEIEFALKKSLIEMALAGEKHGSEFAKNIIIASKSIPSDTQELTLNLEQVVSEHETEQLSASWRLVSDPSELDDIQDLKNIWEKTEYCIAQAYEQLCKNKTLDRRTQKCPKIIAGKGFNKSVKDLHLDNQPAVLASIFTNMVIGMYDLGAYKRTVTAKKGTNHHALQDDPNHQAVRDTDNATAWRIYLSGSYRLHYWLLPDGSAELSKVGVHPDMTIIY